MCLARLQVVLDGGARDDLVLPAAGQRRGARGFRPADVASLLGILRNAGLAMELRRSAAEQLAALAAEPGLREALEAPVRALHSGTPLPAHA